MKKILLTLLLASPLIWAEQDHSDMHDHSHEGHLHDTMVDGTVSYTHLTLPTKA